MSIDHDELRDSARKMFEGEGLIPDRARSWDLVSEMGWLGLTVPEELGGLGLGRAEASIFYTELGRVLAPVPFLSSMLAIEAVCNAPALDDREGWIGRLVGGEIVAVSLTGKADPLAIKTVSGYDVSGTLKGVAEASDATHVLVTGDDLCAFVPLAQDGVTVTPQPLWDKSRNLSDVAFADVAIDPALILATGEEASKLREALQSSLHFALAADSVGGASAALDMTVEYLGTRRQFDRPLALFQALKHRCADLRVALASAEALLWKYLDVGSALPLDASAQAGGLKAYAASAYRAITEESIQLHGGIGLTAEHPCHLFLKRALLNATLGGSTDEWEEKAGAQVMRLLESA